jgi:hypothetical protein
VFSVNTNRLELEREGVATAAALPVMPPMTPVMSEQLSLAGTAGATAGAAATAGPGRPGIQGIHGVPGAAHRAAASRYLRWDNYILRDTRLSRIHARRRFRSMGGRVNAWWRMYTRKRFSLSLHSPTQIVESGVFSDRLPAARVFQKERNVGSQKSVWPRAASLPGGCARAAGAGASTAAHASSRGSSMQRMASVGRGERRGRCAQEVARPSAPAVRKAGSYLN